MKIEYFYTVHCISLSGDCIVNIEHLKAESPEQAMVLAEKFFPVKAQSVEVWRCCDT